MAIRDYDHPDPTRVVGNIRKVLVSGNMGDLEKGAYQFLITHCGFIAHYDHQGFIATYRDDLTSFVHQFLSQLGIGWDTWLDNKGSHLYDVSYKGRVLADIIRELIPIFEWHRPAIEAAYADRQKAKAEALLRRLAGDLGYQLVEKGGERDGMVAN